MEIPSDSCGTWPGPCALALSVALNSMETLCISQTKDVGAKRGEQLSKIKSVLVPLRLLDRTRRWPPISGIGFDGLETFLLLTWMPESPEC